MTTKILIEEHNLIKAMLGSAQKSKALIEQDLFPDQQFFFDMIEFADKFVDRYHHFKEEYIMFGLLAQKKEGALDSEIGALRFQHERCRKFISEIESSIAGYLEKDEIAVTHLLENLSSYISVLQRHIYKEETTYFPIVESEFSDDEKDMLKKQFNKEISRHKDFFKKNQELVNRMEALLSV